MGKKEKVRLRDIVAVEKTRMLPLNFKVSYVFTPLYLAVSLLLIVAAAVLAEIGGEAHPVPCLVCLGAFALISILFLATVPAARKKAIESELARYDFDTSKIPASDRWDFSTGERALEFDEHGMRVDGALHYYNHLEKRVVTSNFYKRVDLCLMFAVSREQIVILNVTPAALKMLTCLNITLDNQPVLDYILSNKREAFRRIYDKGYVVLPRNDGRQSAGGGRP